MSVPAEWFREWFGEAYLSLYPHRDEDEAATAVRLFVERTGLAEGGRILDLACGAGRHLAHLLEEGADGFGIDLSGPLLREAASRPEVGGRLARADMRALPFAGGTFDGLVNFFTSFGYFLTETEDRQVLDEIRRVLRPGAPFVMDYLNAEWVVSRLDPETVGRVNGQRVRQTRWVDGGQVFKRIEIGEEGAETRVFHERVRLYRPAELETLLEATGLRPRTRYGGYDGRPFTPDSPRLILFGTAV